MDEASHKPRTFSYDLILIAVLGAVLLIIFVAIPADKTKEYEASLAATYLSLAKMPTIRKFPISSLRLLMTGEKLTAEMAELFEEKFGHKVLPVYRTTEAGLISCDTTGKYPESVGKVVNGVELKLEDTEDEAKQAIWVRSAAVSKTFIPARSVPSYGPPKIGGIHKEGWLRTGDIGKIDENGQLILCGREDDMIRIDQKRAYISEVEECLMNYPKVLTAKVIANKEEFGQTRLEAEVTTTAQVTMEEILDYCTAQLASHKVPRRVNITVEQPIRSFTPSYEDWDDNLG